MDIGTKIKNAREDKDIYQKDMAKLIPMNQSNYSKIERNFQEPNMYQLKRIAEILNIDLNSLLDINYTVEPCNNKKCSETDDEKTGNKKTEKEKDSYLPEIRFALEVKNLYEKYFKTAPGN